MAQYITSAMKKLVLKVIHALRSAVTGFKSLPSQRKTLQDKLLKNDVLKQGQRPVQSQGQQNNPG